jgi:hypothetical protein
MPFDATPPELELLVAAIEGEGFSIVIAYVQDIVQGSFVVHQDMSEHTLSVVVQYFACVFDGVVKSLLSALLGQKILRPTRVENWTGTNPYPVSLEAF